MASVVFVLLHNTQGGGTCRRFLASMAEWYQPEPYHVTLNLVGLNLNSPNQCSTLLHTTLHIAYLVNCALQHQTQKNKHAWIPKTTYPTLPVADTNASGSYRYKSNSNLHNFG